MTLTLTFICTFTIIMAQNKSKAIPAAKNKNCIHYHCDNPKTTAANCETLHPISSNKINDFSKISGRLSFKLNGVQYECSGTSAQFYTVQKNFLHITIYGKLNDSSQLMFTYRVKPKTPVGKNLNSSAFVNTGNYQINFGRDIVYNYLDAGTYSNGPLNINVLCAFVYGGIHHLLNGTFTGTLYSKSGEAVAITDGIFCSDKLY